MSSTRLPGKVMLDICGQPVLAHVINRLKAARHIDTIVVATTIDRSDDVIGSWCRSNSVQFYRGSLEDVLDRYYKAAKEFNARTIVRITSDCPLIDPTLVDAAIEKFSTGNFDHVSIDPTYPDGLDAEVFSFAALARAHKEATLSSEREHVTPYIWKNAQTFRLGRVVSEADLSRMRWTVDDEKDFLFVGKIYEALMHDGRVFSTAEILKFIEANPSILEINSATMRNEGYAKSLKEDRVIKE